MLLVSGFTFFGLSMLQNMASFTDFFGDTKISFTVVMSSEEENETTNTNEVKENYAKHNNGSLSDEFLQKSKQLKFYTSQACEIIYFKEVPTPPPEHSFS